jgi:adenine-specific DNA-methyltransferase
MKQEAVQVFDTWDESDDYLNRQIITYIGNKRSLLPFIGKGIDVARRALGQERIKFLDLFSGSGIVSRYAKRFSSTLYANDLERYSDLLNRCYLSNQEDVDLAEVSRTIAALHKRVERELAAGFITQLYAPKNEKRIGAGERVFYTRRNAMYIDTARQLIAELPQPMQTYVLAPLLAAASVHTNTSGVFKGFYKNKEGIGQYGGTGKNALTRILKDITLEVPVLSRFSSEVNVLRQDANKLVHDLPEVDVAYFDPPYNQHPYGSNYFMLNLIADYTPPQETSEVSGIPTGWNRSDYNKRARAEAALFDAVENCKAKFVLISYNSEGFVSHERFLSELQRCGEVSVMDMEYNTFRGCRNLRNRDTYVTEFLYLVDKRGGNVR